MGSKEAFKLIANNKKAYHDYFIDEKYECGIELFGTEVKSIRMGKCSIKEAFVRIDNSARSMSTACMSIRMRREIFSIKTRSARENF